MLAESYDFLLEEAARRGNGKAVRELRAIGRPPLAPKAKRVEARWQGRLLGLVRGVPFPRLLRIVLHGPEASILDLPNILRGLECSHHAMWTEVSAIDLTMAVPELRMPVFFSLGRDDHVIGAGTSAAYFDVLTAPLKRLVWLEESAHEPPFEEPAHFNASMVTPVRPLMARGRSAVMAPHRWR